MIDLTDYGYDGPELPGGLIPGRVTEQQRDLYTIITFRGEAQAVLKGSFLHGAEERVSYPCVGDFVALRLNENGVSQISGLLPRRSKFSRADLSGHAEGYVKTILEQVVAANFDYVFILSSVNNDFNVNRIARYITQARQSGGQPVVVLTKSDLNPGYGELIAEVNAAAPGVPVCAVSSRERTGLEAFGDYLKPGKTAVFLGMSGVGKSSLLNALADEELMAVKETRSVDDSKGRHTTTHRHLFMLPSGAMVIDTPGMRELGLFGADEAIEVNFSGAEEIISRCRFSDCRHGNEPGCAVKRALSDGTLDQKTWERYLAQKRENKFVDDRAGYLSDKKEWGKSVSKMSRQMKKAGKMKR